MPTRSDTVFKGLPEQSVTWMSHGDYMAKVPEGFSLVAHSAACPTDASACLCGAA